MTTETGCTVASMVQVVSVVAGVVISVATFFAAKAKEANARKAEAARPFLQLRQDRYTEVVRAASVLVAPATHTSEELQQAKKRFFELYWGELSLVEDKKVETAMVALAEAIDPDLAKETKPTKASYQLAHALRDSLLESWHIRDDATLGSATR